MIKTYRYEGRHEEGKDGKKSVVLIQPQVVLGQTGPFIQVIITHTRIVQENFKKQGKASQRLV